MASSSSDDIAGDLTSSDIIERVERMDVVPTRFLDSHITNTYLSFPDVCHFRSGSNWFSMLRLNTPTYPRISKEFISSLQLHYDDEDCLDNFCIEFRMGGVKYKLSIANLSEAYGIKNWQNRTKFDEFNVSDFWRKITTEDSFEITKSRASQIKNPTLRYFHYVIANTVMGRSKGIEKVCPWDLFALWGLTVGNKLNMVYFMLKN